MGLAEPTHQMPGSAETAYERAVRIRAAIIQHRQILGQLEASYTEALKGLSSEVSGVFGDMGKQLGIEWPTQVPDTLPKSE